MKVYLNGDFVDAKDAKISVYDSGFLLGDGLFETMRAYSGTIFGLNRHLDRLLGAVKALEFENIPDRGALAIACNEALTINGLVNARMRLTITRGPVQAPNAASAKNQSPHPTVLITAEPYLGYKPELYERGISAIILQGYRFSNDLLSMIKSTSYLSSVLARREAVASGHEEAILINERDHVTEGSYTNIFAVKSGGIFTPRVADGLLPGITREYVIEIVVNAGYPMYQQSIHVSDLLKFDELFVTNSLMEVMPLTRIDGKAIGDGTPGPVTLDIASRYKEIVAAETATINT